MAKKLVGESVPVRSIDDDKRPLLRGTSIRKPFLYAVNKDSWSFLVKKDGKGVFVPNLITIWMLPGVNGLRTSNGNPGEPVKGLRKFMANHMDVDGRQILHPEELGDEYRRRVQVRQQVSKREVIAGWHYMSPWQSLELYEDGDAEEVVDEDARIAWLEKLVQSPLIPFPRPRIKRQIIESYEGAIRLMEGRKNPDPRLPTMKKTLIKLKATPLPSADLMKPKRKRGRAAKTETAPLEAESEVTE